LNKQYILSPLTSHDLPSTISLTTINEIGTTGNPKGALISHTNMMVGVATVLGWLEMVDEMVDMVDKMVDNYLLYLSHNLPFHPPSHLTNHLISPTIS